MAKFTVHQMETVETLIKPPYMAPNHECNIKYMAKFTVICALNGTSPSIASPTPSAHYKINIIF